MIPMPPGLNGKAKGQPMFLSNRLSSGSRTARQPSRVTWLASLVALAVLTMLSGEKSVAEETPDPANYYISLAGAGAFWALRVNDITVWSDFQGADTNLTVPVNAYLKQGQNEIDLTFVSVKGSPLEYNVANPDFYFVAQLQRVDLVSRDRQQATMVNLALDAENGVVFPEVSRFGHPVETRSTPPMKIGRDRQDKADLVSGWGDQWTGRRVTAEFEISDPLPAGPWGVAPVIEDTHETRAQLLDAYRKFHAVLQSGDARQVRANLEPAWRHLATTMHYASLEEYLEKVSPLQDLAVTDSQGRTLQPLDLVLGPEDFQIERMAGGRLVRIIPDPIIWNTPSDPDNVGSLNVAFFRAADGSLQVGAVLY